MRKKAQHVVETPEAIHVGVPVVAQIAKLLDDHGWKFTVDGTDIQFVTRGDNGTIEVTINAEDDPHRYFIYAYCPVTVPEAHRLEMVKYVVGANPPLAFTKLMMSPDGHVYAEVGSPLGSDGFVDGEVFQVLLFVTLNILDDRIPDVLQIVYGGATAAEVLARRERGDAPKD